MANTNITDVTYVKTNDRRDQCCWIRQKSTLPWGDTPVRMLDDITNSSWCGKLTRSLVLNIDIYVTHSRICVSNFPSLQLQHTHYQYKASAPNFPLPSTRQHMLTKQERRRYIIVRSLYFIWKAGRRGSRDVKMGWVAHLLLRKKT